MDIIVLFIVIFIIIIIANSILVSYHVRNEMCICFLCKREYRAKDIKMKGTHYEIICKHCDKEIADEAINKAIALEQKLKLKTE